MDIIKEIKKASVDIEKAFDAIETAAERAKRAIKRSMMLDPPLDEKRRLFEHAASYLESYGLAIHAVHDVFQAEYKKIDFTNPRNALILFSQLLVTLSGDCFEASFEPETITLPEEAYVDVVSKRLERVLKKKLFLLTYLPVLESNMAEVENKIAPLKKQEVERIERQIKGLTIDPLLEEKEIQSILGLSFAVLEETQAIYNPIKLLMHVNEKRITRYIDQLEHKIDYLQSLPLPLLYALTVRWLELPLLQFTKEQWICRITLVNGYLNKLEERETDLFCTSRVRDKIKKLKQSFDQYPIQTTGYLSSFLPFWNSVVVAVPVPESHNPLSREVLK